MNEHAQMLMDAALKLARDTGSAKVLVFLSSAQDCRWLLKACPEDAGRLALVAPPGVAVKEAEFKSAGVGLVHGWSGNQSRFSRIKYAFLHAVLGGIIEPGSKVVCVLGPFGKSHLDTITVHDLSLSWSEEFPFDPRAIAGRDSFNTVMAVVDIALDIGALGREGKPVGTTFVIGDHMAVLKSSHQAVFNPFRGYPKKDRLITRPEVVESVKELAQLDGAFVVSADGYLEAAGRHLNASPKITKELRGLGSRHRTAAGITRQTGAVAVVVSESTGKVTIFDSGRVVITLEPVIGRRLV